MKKEINFIIGSHISLNKANKHLFGVVQETINNGANSFMIFTGAPQNKKRIPVNELMLKEAKDLAIKNQIDFSKAVIHAPYIINLATNVYENIDFNIDFLVSEINRTVEIGIKFVILHPGFHNGQTLEEGMKYLIKSLSIVLEKTKNLDYFLCLETMSGKKNQIGKTFEEIQKIIDGCKKNKKLAICLDTCHMHDAGYDLKQKDQILKKIDELIGIERIKVIHLGDSQNPIGTGSDRHANLGYGHIGFDTLISWAYDEYISKITIIVETPFWIKKVNDKKQLISPYKHEIKLIRNKTWKPIPEKTNLPVYDIKG